MSINEAINIQTTSINAIAPTTGSLSIGDSQTTGVLNLGTGTGRTATGLINIGNSTGVAPIRIESGSTKNTEGDPAISIGTGANNRWIKIGSSLGGRNNIISLGNILFKTGIAVNEINGTSQNGTTIYLGNGQTTGALNLGCGFALESPYVRAIGADVNIATGASTACNVNIMNGNTTAGSVNIANGTGITQSTAVNIGSGSTTGAVTIGNTGNTTTLASGTTNIATTVGSTSVINILNGGGATTGGSVNIANGASQTTTVNIGSTTGTGAILLNTTTGEIGIGNNQTTGVLNLGTGTGRTATGVINIGTGSGAGNAINIGTGAGIASTTKAVVIGGTDTTSSREYDVFINKIKFKTYNGGNECNLNDQVSVEPFVFFGRQSVGVLNIAGGVGSARSGAVNIATSSTNTCAVNIANEAGSTSVATGGSVNIASGTGGASTLYTTTVSIASGTTTGAVTIGNTGNTTTLASGTTNIATAVGSTSVINILNGGGATTGGSVNIANGASQTTAVNIASGTGTGTVTIGGASNTTNLNSGTINVNGNLIMGTGDNITLQPSTGYVTPSAGQLGFNPTTTGSTNTTSAGVTATLRSVSLTAGVWLLIGNSGMGGSGASAFLSISVTGSLDNNAIASNSATANFLHISRIVFLTATTTYNLVAQTANSSTLNNVNFNAVRIA